MKEYKDLVETWFYDIKPWSPGDVACEREAWVRCQGVPLHGWSSQFLELLVIRLGRFVSLDTNTMNLKRLDMARVLIRTSSWEVINQLVKVRINGSFYNIRLLEKPFPEYTFNHVKPRRWRIIVLMIQQVQIHYPSCQMTLLARLLNRLRGNGEYSKVV